MSSYNRYQGDQQPPPKRQRQRQRNRHRQDDAEQGEEYGYGNSYSSKQSNYSSNYNNYSTGSNSKKQNESTTTTSTTATATKVSTSLVVPAGSFRIFIGNLPWSATVEDLKKYFKQCGNVWDVRIASHPTEGKQTVKPKGFAHIEFEKEIDVEHALELNGKPWIDNETILTISVAEEKPKPFKKIAVRDSLSTPVNPTSSSTSKESNGQSSFKSTSNNYPSNKRTDNFRTDRNSSKRFRR